jgi:2-methylisocitrate lyase-like PEP mutase family enzyme
LFTLNSILEITNKPIFYNASNINVKDVPFIVKRMERLGVSAIITESSGNNTIELITEIKETRKDDNFLIVTKIYLRNTIDDVVSYIKTGADIILIDLTEWNWTEILKFCNSYNTIPNRKYLAAIISDEFLSFENKLKELNVNIFIYYDQLYKGAISGMEKASAEILKNF